MPVFCHRCQGELPQTASGGRDTGRSHHGLEPEAMLFCPHCSAPQIRLPEHMRPLPAASADDSTTGNVPPPNPRQVDWPAALRAGALVAAAAGLFSIMGWISPFFAFLTRILVLIVPVAVLTIYRRSRPTAFMDRHNGTRIGLAGGLLVLAALGVGFAIGGVGMRFGLHGMEEFDRQTAETNKLFQEQVQTWLKDQGASQEEQQLYHDTMNSPTLQSAEVRAGSTLAGLGLNAGMLLLLWTAEGALLGAFAGARTRAPEPH